MCARQVCEAYVCLVDFNFNKIGEFILAERTTRVGVKLSTSTENQL